MCLISRAHIIIAEIVDVASFIPRLSSSVLFLASDSELGEGLGTRLRRSDALQVLVSFPSLASILGWERDYVCVSIS